MTDQRTSEAYWLAVQERNRKADGSFVYSVVTTGIYCRPSCPARRPNPDNIRYFTSCEEADGAGFRPCLRCRPNEQALSKRHAAAIEAACHAMEREASNPPDLTELAKQAGMSASHFHRTFRAITGTTPKQFALAARRNSLHQQLGQAETVTEAIYAAGYNSSSAFYEQADNALGMTPTQFRQGGVDSLIQFATASSDLGFVLVAQSDRGICFISLGEDPDSLRTRLAQQFPSAQLNEASFELRDALTSVIALLHDPAMECSLPLDIQGTAFQQRVWNALRRIPAGTTKTYTEIAEEIGSPASVRAVAGACASNVLAVAIPCHRVVRQDGSLSGYPWGVERKKQLLHKERVASEARTT